MMPPPPPEVQQWLATIPWYINLLQLVSPLFVGILLIWWKLHQIGVSFAEAKAMWKNPPKTFRPSPPRGSLEPLIEITEDAAGWGAGIGLIRGLNYRDDTSEAEL